MFECRHCGNRATAGIREAKGQTGPCCLSCAALDQLTVPATPEMRGTAPDVINRGPARALTGGENGLWSHQETALRLLTEDKNVVAATATASGKSKIFQTWAVHQALGPKRRSTLVFYPVKALANDQMERWRQAFAETGADPGAAGQITGDLRSMSERDRILRDCQVVIMTPDVAQAWFTRRLSSPAVQSFLERLGTIVIDEAHSYEGVFGSNTAMLFRRIIAAAAAKQQGGAPQVIAATATVSRPAEHLKGLTGLDCQVVGEDTNGSPRRERTLLHLSPSPPEAGMEESAARLLESLLNADPEAQAIIFYDSRQGVERLCRRLDRPDKVIPYRAGYLAEDRKRAERLLHSNSVRAICATSALELGIDMPDLSHGINIGLPQSRKQLHQRMGRVGRTKPGTFVILAAEDQFSQYGETLPQYAGKGMEPCHLHLGNSVILGQHAKCMNQELVSTNRPAGKLQQPPEWPPGFENSLKAEGANLGNNATENGKMGGKPPHLACNLRNTGEEELDLLPEDSEPGSRGIGSINMGTALKEAYPGATYLHAAKAYTVTSWGRRPQDRSPIIRIAPQAGSNSRTRPILRRTATIDLARAERQRTNPTGLAAKVTEVSVTESVEGLSVNGKDRTAYQQAKNDNPGLTRKSKYMTTTGVYLEIGEEWFGDHNRAMTANALRRMLGYRRSIASGDLGMVTENIFLRSGNGYRLAENAILLYDNINGGLALTDEAYDELENYAQRMMDGALASKDGRGLTPATAAKFREWTLRRGKPSQEQKNGEQGWWRIIRPGTRVRLLDGNQEEDRPGVTGRITWGPNGPVYQVGLHGGGSATAPETLLRPAGDLDDWQIWHPASGRIKELADNVD